MEEDVENEVITDEQTDEGNHDCNNESNGNENTSDSDSVEDWTQIKIQPRIKRGNKLLSDNAQMKPLSEQQTKRLNGVNKRTTRSTKKDKEGSAGAQLASDNTAVEYTYRRTNPVKAQAEQLSTRQSLKTTPEAR